MGASIHWLLLMLLMLVLPLLLLLLLLVVVLLPLALLLVLPLLLLLLLLLRLVYMSCIYMAFAQRYIPIGGNSLRGHLWPCCQHQWTCPWHGWVAGRACNLKWWPGTQAPWHSWLARHPPQLQWQWWMPLGRLLLLCIDGM
jgi:hypothetical protein